MTLESISEFATALVAVKVDAVSVPLHLAFDGNLDHANLFKMGAALRQATGMLLKAGSTPVFTHHANRQLKVGDPMELQHLVYSGLEQFAKQFLLVNRQQTYRSDGVHDIWLRAGCSAGYGGLRGVHIAEGLTATEGTG